MQVSGLSKFCRFPLQYNWLQQNNWKNIVELMTVNIHKFLYFTVVWIGHIFKIDDRDTNIA
jgi:hypothetical protein